MMKIGKEAVLAIIESALFVLGAVFFLLVLIIPSNPVWALIAGIVFGVTCAIVWLCPYVSHLIQNLILKIHHRIERIKGPTINAEDVAEQILKSDKTQRKSYELHRADAYDNITDDIISQVEEPTTTKKTKSTTKSTSKTK
jgi:hypothetical protein